MATASAEPIRVLSWNVESGGNDPAIIARQLAEFARADLYCLQEVGARNFGRYGAAIRDAHSNGYRYVPSVTGRGDRLLVIYDSERLSWSRFASCSNTASTGSTTGGIGHRCYSNWKTARRALRSA